MWRFRSCSSSSYSWGCIELRRCTKLWRFRCCRRVQFSRLSTCLSLCSALTRWSMPCCVGARAAAEQCSYALFRTRLSICPLLCKSRGWSRQCRFRAVLGQVDDTSCCDDRCMEVQFLSNVVHARCCDDRCIVCRRCSSGGCGRPCDHTVTNWGLANSEGASDSVHRAV